MADCLKTDLWKLFHGRMFSIAVLMGTCISGCNIITNMINMQDYRSVALRTGLTDPSGFSLFILWLPMGSFGIAADLYRLAFPIMAALPYGASYWKEFKSGYSRQIITRCGTGCYYLSKYLTVFIGGGSTVSVILIMNLLANALVCPALQPSSEMMYMTDSSFLVHLYVTNAWIHAVLWIVASFIMAGAVATTVFVAGHRGRHPAAIVLVPFVITFVLSLIGNILSDIVRIPVFLDIQSLFTNMTVGSNPLWWIMAVSVFFALMGGIGLIVDRMRYEIL